MYDELPRHHIVVPEVKVWQPDPRLAEIALEGMKMKNLAIMHAMDQMSNAADPETIARRRMAIMNANFEAKAMPYKEQELAYQTQMLEAQAKYLKEHPDEPWGMPKNAGEAIQRIKYNNMKTDIERANNVFNPTDVTRQTPDYKLNQYRSGLGSGMQLGQGDAAKTAAEQHERDLEAWGNPPFDLNAPSTGSAPATGTAADQNNPPAADLSNTGDGSTRQVGPPLVSDEDLSEAAEAGGYA